MCYLDLIEEHPDQKVGTFYTTPLFWNCKCEEGYIHAVTEEIYFTCNTRRENGPDARVTEIFRYAYEFHLPPILVNTLAAAAEAVAPALTAGIAIPF